MIDLVVYAFEFETVGVPISWTAISSHGVAGSTFVWICWNKKEIIYKADTDKLVNNFHKLQTPYRPTVSFWVREIGGSNVWTGSTFVMISERWEITIVHKTSKKINYMSPVKRICVFEHSVMTNFNCACPAIQRGQGSGFLSESSSWLTACMSEQRRFWRDCADEQARLNLRCSHRR